MSKKIMILGASILQLPAIQKAKELGLNVVVVDMNPESIGFKEDNIDIEIISTTDISAVVDAAKKHKIDGIMTLSTDKPILCVAAVAQELGIVGVTWETAIKATNKAIMRNILKEYGVPVPEFYKVSNRNEYEFAVHQINKPYIVKPVDNSGSKGIFLIDDLRDKETISKAYDYSHQNSQNGDVIVEEYMRGPEVSVEALTIDGEFKVIQITDKLTTGAPHFVEMGHSQPSILGLKTCERIIEVAKAANKAVGITNGPSHTEIIITDDGPKIVELGARLGGDFITTDLVPLSTGVNMVECCIKIAIGEKPDIESKFNKGSAIRYFRQKAGIITNITGIKKAKKVTGIIKINILCGVGDTVSEIDSSGSRIGFVIAQSDNAINAVKACEIALEKKCIVIS